MAAREPFEEKYQILEKLGQGGMGAVYKVRHRLLDELRVIKVIRSVQEPTPEAEERFLREARTACRLRHPNVALLHDFALGEDGRAYIVLELIEGATLRQLIASRGTLPLSLALEIGRQAAAALQYLHRQRIVHRDISPGNLMLTRDFEGRPLVKLIDLGLARSLEQEVDSLTRGVFVGKVRYASPEQFDEGPIDERSDLYSLGVVLYELVTGHCPIAGHDAKTWMASHLFRPPLDFAETDPDGEVPEDLRALILRLLAKNPEERFAQAEDLGQALREVQERFPLQGDELAAVFRDRPAAPALLDEEPSSSAGPPAEESSASLQLRRPRRPLEESVSLPLGRGGAGASRAADGPSWDVRRPAAEGGSESSGVRRERPVRRGGLLVPALLGVFSLAIIFTLIGLYAMTSMFQPGRADPEVEEVTAPPVAAPAEAEAPAEAGVPGEPSLVEEMTGSAEPVAEAAAEAAVVPEMEEVRAAERPASPPEAPAPPPPARRAPVVERPGGVRPGPGVVPPVPLDDPRYSYPAAARGRGIELDVRLDLLIDERGRVIDAVVREGDAEGLGFNETALAAARRMTFQPATRGNVPVRMWTEMIFQFSEPRGTRRPGR
ncbi:MAG TPA: hypothetical protein DD490_33750 [Acidobacteria bacterium]|nr:hypothetical protein [Acidobacteriota bacterium]